MCFVSYIPLVQGGYLIGSNRDESIHRASAVEPAQVSWGANTGIAPQDGKAHGTWIATRHDGCTMVLLNGAQQPHRHQPPYRHSRGLIIPMLMHHENIVEAWERILLKNVEPFTLVMAGNSHIWQAQWDGKSKTLKQLPAHKPHCWSSATLYNSQQVAIRASWFFEQMALQSFSQASMLMQFHTSNFGSKDYDIMLERPELQVATVSSTVVDFSWPNPVMQYIDHLKKLDFTLKLNILPAYAGE